MQNNPQFVRTDKAITQALISLLKVKPFEKITVQDILDETPVTRSTFYKHFHDKYEIAEKMQQEFFEAQDTLQKAFHGSPNGFSPSMLKISQQNHEIMEALLKIHTENVNLRDAMAEQAVDYYLERRSGKSAELEAEIFAQAVTAFRISATDAEEFTFEFMHDTFISVFLNILGLADDEEIKKAIKKKSLAKLLYTP